MLLILLCTLMYADFLVGEWFLCPTAVQQIRASRHPAIQARRVAIRADAVRSTLVTAHSRKVPCCPPCCWDRACVCCIADSRSLLQQPTDSSMVFLYFISYKTSIIRAFCCRHTRILSSLPRLYTFKQFYHCYQTRLVVGRED